MVSSRREFVSFTQYVVAVVCMAIVRQIAPHRRVAFRDGDRTRSIRSTVDPGSSAERRAGARGTGAGRAARRAAGARDHPCNMYDHVRK